MEQIIVSNTQFLQEPLPLFLRDFRPWLVAEADRFAPHDQEDALRRFHRPGELGVIHVRVRVVKSGFQLPEIVECDTGIILSGIRQLQAHDL